MMSLSHICRAPYSPLSLFRHIRCRDIEVRLLYNSQAHIHEKHSEEFALSNIKRSFSKDPFTFVSELIDVSVYCTILATVPIHKLSTILNKAGLRTLESKLTAHTTIAIHMYEYLYSLAANFNRI